MPPKMTSTAYGQGVKNALVCGIGFLAVWLVAGGAVWQMTGRSLAASFGLGFALLWGLVFAWFVAAWLYGRQAGGRVLLDCGPTPSRKLFLVNAGLALILGLKYGLDGGSAAKMFGPAALVLFGVSYSVYSLIMAGGRLQVRENGLWQYCGLLRWGKVKSYHWADDGTLLLQSRGPSSFLRGAFPVPPEHKDVFDQLLRKHCAAHPSATKPTDV